MKQITRSCDIRECTNSDKTEKDTKIKMNLDKTIQVIFHTDQTEGRWCLPYLSQVTIDLCADCLNKVLKGNYINATGAMGYNEYFFTSNL